MTGWFVLLMMIPYGNSSDQVVMQQFATKEACIEAGTWFTAMRMRVNGPKLLWTCSPIYK